MKTIAYIFILFWSVNGLYAQETSSKSNTVTLLTSSECEDCKVRIEEVLNYTKGIKFAELDVATKQLTVKYNPSKITLEQVKLKINAIGYDAGDFLAKPEQVEQLPLCCRPGGMKKE
jgi:copper chaperone CopZ